MAAKEKTTKYGDEYWCYFQIIGEGIGDGQVKRAIGIDSMQAVILAIRYIGTIIKCSEFVERNGFDKNNDWDNFGFPVCDIA